MLCPVSPEGLVFQNWRRPPRPAAHTAPVLLRLRFTCTCVQLCAVAHTYHMCRSLSTSTVKALDCFNILAALFCPSVTPPFFHPRPQPLTATNLLPIAVTLTLQVRDVTGITPLMTLGTGFSAFALSGILEITQDRCVLSPFLPVAKQCCVVRATVAGPLTC